MYLRLLTFISFTKSCLFEWFSALFCFQLRLYLKKKKNLEAGFSFGLVLNHTNSISQHEDVTALKTLGLCNPLGYAGCIANFAVSPSTLLTLLYIMTAIKTHTRTQHCKTELKQTTLMLHIVMLVNFWCFLFGFFFFSPHCATFPHSPSLSLSLSQYCQCTKCYFSKIS